ncbi:MAG: hypothetical protein LIP16_02820 [Clostridium sp.]|nr:hypothetical protein [Clostridium sp.]
MNLQYLPEHWTVPGAYRLEAVPYDTIKRGSAAAAVRWPLGGADIPLGQGEEKAGLLQRSSSGISGSELI